MWTEIENGQGEKVVITAAQFNQYVRDNLVPQKRGPSWFNLLGRRILFMLFAPLWLAMLPPLLAAMLPIWVISGKSVDAVIEWWMQLMDGMRGWVSP